MDRKHLIFIGLTPEVGEKKKVPIPPKKPSKGTNPAGKTRNQWWGRSSAWKDESKTEESQPWPKQDAAKRMSCNWSWEQKKEYDSMERKAKQPWARTSAWTEEWKTAVTHEECAWEQKEAQPWPKQDAAKRMSCDWSWEQKEEYDSMERKAKQPWARTSAWTEEGKTAVTHEACLWEQKAAQPRPEHGNTKGMSCNWYWKLKKEDASAGGRIEQQWPRTSAWTDESKTAVTPKVSGWQEEEAEPRPKEDNTERIPPFWNGEPTDAPEGAERRARVQWVRVRARRAAEKLYPSKIFLF